MNIICIILTYMFNRHRKCKNGEWELLNTQFLVFNMLFFKGIYSFENESELQQFLLLDSRYCLIIILLCASS